MSLPRLKVAFPLSLKISAWLLLNFVLLAAVAMGFLVAEGGLNWNSLVMSPAGNRLQSLASAISGEVSAASESARDAVLQRFGSAYNTRFYIFNGEGKQLAGEPITLPSVVTARIEPRFFGIPGGPMPEGGERGREAGRARAQAGNSPVLTDNPNGASGPGNFGIPGGPPPNGERFWERRGLAPSRRFLALADDVSGYWIGVGIPFAMGTVERLGGNGPENRTGGPGGFRGPPDRTTLLINARSLWGVLRLLELQPVILVCAAVLVVSILFWLPLIGGITRSVAQLTRATEQIAEGRFDTRVPAQRRDEIGRLGESVNRMAARLDTLVSGQKRFLGDVAHELCSPLARLQMATSILEERAPATVQAAVADVREEVQQMNALVNELLAFTKAGLKPRDLVLKEVAIPTLVTETLTRENIVDRVTTHLPDDAKAIADPELLSRALANLVRNAVRYAGDAGPVTITVTREANTLSIAVEDEGPGVPAEALARLGEPFYRPESARSRETGGVGLGLSIVRSSMEACGGGVRFTNRTPRGFRAELWMPAAQA